MRCDLLIKDSAGRSKRDKIGLFEELTKNIITDDVGTLLVIQSQRTTATICIAEIIF